MTVNSFCWVCGKDCSEGAGVPREQRYLHGFPLKHNDLAAAPSEKYPQMVDCKCHEFTMDFRRPLTPSMLKWLCPVCAEKLKDAVNDCVLLLSKGNSVPMDIPTALDVSLSRTVVDERNELLALLRYFGPHEGLPAAVREKMSRILAEWKPMPSYVERFL